jgi:hypothetical protein
MAVARGTTKYKKNYIKHAELKVTNLGFRDIKAKIQLRENAEK